VTGNTTVLAYARPGGSDKVVLAKRAFPDQVREARRNAAIQAVMMAALGGYAVYRLYDIGKDLGWWRAARPFPHSTSFIWVGRSDAALSGVGASGAGVVVWTCVKEIRHANHVLDAYNEALEIARTLNLDEEFPLARLTRDQIARQADRDSLATLKFGESPLDPGQGVDPLWDFKNPTSSRKELAACLILDRLDGSAARFRPLKINLSVGFVQRENLESINIGLMDLKERSDQLIVRRLGDDPRPELIRELENFGDPRLLELFTQAQQDAGTDVVG
jgi:hypothetical protein